MEIIANAVQTVAANQNVYFTDSVTSGNYSIEHRDGSGLVTLRGVTILNAVLVLEFISELILLFLLEAL